MQNACNKTGLLLHYTSERIKTMFFFCLTSAIENPVERPSASRRALQELLGRVGEGDTAAFIQLYEETRAAVYGFIFSILKNRQDAEDALQEVFLTIDANAGNYRPSGSPMGWIMAIAKNTSLMLLRGRRQAVSLEEAPEPAAAAGPFPTEDRLVLEKAMLILDETERQVVMLHAVAEMKHREIAQLLGLSLSGTLSKYRRALHKLRNQLEGAEP